MSDNQLSSITVHLYHKTSQKISQIVTKQYSTSFYWSSLFFSKDIKKAIFNIYGFVRMADEIVDSFRGYDKEMLLEDFENDLEKALDRSMSINPILNAFQLTVKKYDLERAHIRAFLESMRSDLTVKEYKSRDEFNRYIYGSAEVVGLMCLKIFCKNQPDKYEALKDSAVRLGAAFQKVNFLRDLRDDKKELKRTYFPNMIGEKLSEPIKQAIISDIEPDFEAALRGIKRLPKNSKLAVTIAYLYYKYLLKKIKKTPASVIREKRVRSSNFMKVLLVMKAVFYCLFKRI